MIEPRWYQKELIEGTRDAWAAGAQNVLIVSPPRSGKTKTAVWLSEPFIKAGQGVCIQAHREELVRQIAMEYAEFGYEHSLLASSDVVSSIIHRQVKELGRSFVRQNALVTVGSVQTILSRAKTMTQWAARIGLWVTDEAHHLGRQDSQWGKVVAMFPNARGAGFTATPARTDRVSLDRKQGGVFDVMVKGVTARQLIDEGYICDYRIIAPPSSIDRAAIKVGGSGDFTQTGLVEAQKHSTITGDCVASYLRFTPGEQAVAFAVDITHATEMCEAYRAAGVKAEAISSKTPSAIRKQLMDKFERGVFQVLCNVDLFGEGLNVKSITVVIMARPTQSFVLFVQQFFRALTSDHGKQLGTIIDHAGNVGFFGRIYGLPDSYNRWTLYAEERGKKQTRDPEVIPLTTCLECFQAYPAIHRNCPFCGFAPEPSGRSRPDQVDGDLIELDAATLALMRGEASRIDGDPQIPFGASDAVEGAVRKKWRERQEAQAALRHEIALWAGMWRDRGDTDSMIYRRFFFRFDTDIMTAQGLGRAEANELKERILHALAHSQ